MVRSVARVSIIDSVHTRIISFHLLGYMKINRDDTANDCHNPIWDLSMTV